MLRWFRDWFTREPEGIYVQQIQVLKSDKPLDLPAIRPLKARKVWKMQPIAESGRRVVGFPR